MLGILTSSAGAMSFDGQDTDKVWVKAGGCKITLKTSPNSMSGAEAPPIGIRIVPESLQLIWKSQMFAPTELEVSCDSEPRTAESDEGPTLYWPDMQMKITPGQNRAFDCSTRTLKLFGLGGTSFKCTIGNFDQSESVITITESLEYWQKHLR